MIFQKGDNIGLLYLYLCFERSIAIFAKSSLIFDVNNKIGDVKINVSINFFNKKV